MANYTLGRGKVHFSRFKDGTTIPSGFFYIGNTPEFSLNIQSQTLDHFSSDEGIREKDDSVPLEVNRSGSMTTDNIEPKNVALFFFGDDSTVTQSVVSGQVENFANILAGHSYKLGVTTINPAGYFGIDSTGFSVVEALGTAATGSITIASTGPTAGQVITIGGTAYTFVSALSVGPTVANQIKTNATPSVVAQAITDALNGIPGTNVSIGTVPNPNVHATVTGAVVTVIADLAGTSGNSIGFVNTTPAANTTFSPSGGVLTGGLAGATLVNGTDYTLDNDTGVVTLLDTSTAIYDGDTLTVTYSLKASKRSRVISGSTPVEGAMMYITKNPKGDDCVYYLPYVKVTPNGDYALKGDSWQTLPLSLEVLKPATGEAIYRDGLPAYS
jgi:hypothetical protein